MNGLKAVTELAVYLSKNTTVQVFKHVKTTGFSGEFMVVNNLPFTRGKAVNDMNILNLNVHVPKTSSGTVNSKRLGELQTVIEGLIPWKSECEDTENDLVINGHYYTIEADSNPIEDADNTYFINLKINVTF